MACKHLHLILGCQKMADNISLNVEVRNEVGKGASRALRRNNLVPGIIYGGDQEPQAIKIKFNELFRLLKKGRFMSTLSLIHI